MIHHRLALAAIAPALLLACSKQPAPAPSPTVVASPASTPAPTPAATPALAIEGEGLRLFDPESGSARPLSFGTPLAQVQAALAFRGTPRSGRMEECGAGPLDYVKWEDSLTLYGQDGAFMGWFAEKGVGALSTASGIAIGSTRKQLESAYSAEVFQSTLGTEFLAGDLGGLLDGEGKDAKITHLWAGVSCNFR